MSQLPGRKEDEFFIKQRGMTIAWQRSMYCSCFDISSGQPDYNCPTCLGIGRIYDPSLQTKVLITNVRQDKTYSVVGVWELGTCRATFPAGINVGNYDRVMFTKLALTFTEMITRAERPTLGLKDILRFYDVSTILKLRTRDIIYTENVDFTLTKDNNFSYITWANANIIPTGTQYAVLYEHKPEFLVWDVPQVRTDNDYTQLPKFAILRRRDMIAQKAVI